MDDSSSTALAAALLETRIGGETDDDLDNSEGVLLPPTVLQERAQRRRVVSLIPSALHGDDIGPQMRAYRLVHSECGIDLITHLWLHVPLPKPNSKKGVDVFDGIAHVRVNEFAAGDATASAAAAAAPHVEVVHYDGGWLRLRAQLDAASRTFVPLPCAAATAGAAHVASPNAVIELPVASVAGRTGLLLREQRVPREPSTFRNFEVFVTFADGAAIDSAELFVDGESIDGPTELLLGGIDIAASHTASERCSICMDPLYDAEASAVAPPLSCGHLFHSECIEPWLVQHHTCPLCRKTVAGASIARTVQYERVPPPLVLTVPASLTGVAEDKSPPTIPLAVTLPWREDMRAIIWTVRNRNTGEFRGDLLRHARLLLNDTVRVDMPADYFAAVVPAMCAASARVPALPGVYMYAHDPTPFAPLSTRTVRYRSFEYVRLELEFDAVGMRLQQLLGGGQPVELRIYGLARACAELRPNELSRFLIGCEP